MEKRELLEALDKMGCCNPLDLAERMAIAKPIVAAFGALGREQNEATERKAEMEQALRKAEACIADGLHSGKGVSEEYGQAVIEDIRWTLRGY